MSSFTVPEAAPARTILPAAAVLAALAFMTASVASGFSFRGASGVVVLVTLLAWVRPTYVGWPRLLAGLILVILFIPIRRYSLPGNLPFELEPYRLIDRAAARRVGRVAARRSPHPVPAHRLRGPAAA